MAQFTVTYSDGSLQQVQAHSVSQVGSRVVFHVRDEREPVCDLPQEKVAEVRRQIVEFNGMTRTVRARMRLGDEAGRR